MKMQDYSMLEPGDLLVTRNRYEEDNVSPGYWNQVAIYDGNRFVIEAQMEPGYVIEFEWNEFFMRHPRIKVLRFYDASTVGIIVRIAIAKEARKLRGIAYRKLASLSRIFRRRRTRGENCVSVARRAYLKATGIDFGWRIPDDVVADRRFRAIIEKVSDNVWGASVFLPMKGESDDAKR